MRTPPFPPSFVTGRGRKKSRNLNRGLTARVMMSWYRRVAFSWNMRPYVCPTAAMLTKCEQYGARTVCLLFKRLLIRKYTWKLQWSRTWEISTRLCCDLMLRRGSWSQRRLHYNVNNGVRDFKNVNNLSHMSLIFFPRNFCRKGRLKISMAINT